jgi:hypothetical protein
VCKLNHSAEEVPRLSASLGQIHPSLTGHCSAAASCSRTAFAATVWIKWINFFSVQ